MSSTTEQKVDDFEVVTPLLKAMYGEFKELSKKRADGAVSKPKIAGVNRLLKKCRTILADESSLEFLDLLEEDAVPQNSDVVLILSQYDAALKQFRKAYWDAYNDDWRIEEDESEEDGDAAEEGVEGLDGPDDEFSDENDKGAESEDDDENQ